MGYPQPSSDDYVVGGYDFFRLQTPLVSGGDLYESQQSSHAFAIGPESDVSRVRVTYFDEEMANFANQVVIGTERAFVGRLDANLVSQYVPSNRPGRVLIAPDNLWDPDLYPSGLLSNQTTHTVIVIPPVMDVIQYFSDPPGVVAGRNDKIYRFQRVPYRIHGGSAASSYIMFPFYGRRFMSYSVTFDTIVGTVDSISLRGYNLDYTGQTLSSVVPLETNSTTVNSGTTFVGTYSVGQKPASAAVGTGAFDYLELEIVPNAALADTAPGPFVTITVSDTEVPT